MSNFLSGLFGPLFSMSLATPEPNKQSVITGKFKYLGLHDQETEEYGFEFNEDWFRRSSYDVPFEMARFSLCASMSSSLESDILELMDQLGFTYTNTVNEEKEGLNILAGAKITDSVYYPAQIVDGKPYINSIAYAIGKKEIADSTIVMVNIRGGDYGIEWGGDFLVGDGITHEGFEIAAKQVLQGILTFLEREKISDHFKIWIHGYSRAAAVTNVVAAKLDEGLIEGLKPEDIYAFCFECPRTTRATGTQEKLYDNIHCFINPDDLIPRMPMAIWGYKRYGKNYHYPAYESDIHFPEVYKNLLNKMTSILGFSIKPAVNSEHTLDVFINDLAFTAGSPKDFVEHFQMALMQLMIGLFGGHKKAGVSHKIPPELMRALGILEAGVIHLNPQNAKAIGKLLGLGKGGLADISFDSPLLLDHTMQLSLCWMETLKDFTEFGPDFYRIASVNGVTDLTVLNSDNKPVVEVRNGKVSDIPGGLWCEYGISGELVIVLPANSAYTIDFTGALENRMAYTLSEFDMTLGKRSRIWDYGIQSLSGADRLSAFIPEIWSSEAPIFRDQNAVIEAKRVLSGEDIDILSIAARTEGPGSVYGGGYFYPGDFAGFKAVPEDGAAFEGWYLGEQCLSKEAFYQIPAEKDLILTAKFNK